MDEMDQARESLQIYLQANRSFIEEKVYNQFNVECIQNKTLQTLDVDKMVRTIRDIFDFGGNAVYSYFFSHLHSNIKTYIAQQYSSKANQSFFILDIDKLIDIIKYCITHGFDQNAKKAMQSAKERPKEHPKIAPKQEPPTKPAEKPKEKPRVVFVEEVKKVEPPKDEFAHIKSKVSTFLQRDKLPEKKQFKLQKYSMPELSDVMPRYLASIQKTPVVKEEEEEKPVVVAALDINFLNAHRKIMRERLEKLFNFYCFQQQSLGQSPTFDHIKDQGQLMNLGKFIQFCQSTKLFLCKEISKEVLIAEFKRIAEGRLEVSFEFFQRMISKLDEKYLHAMGHDPVNNPVPTFEARLMLNQPTKLGELKKQRNLVFGTRSKEGREVKEWAETSRYPKKELTLHSGRFSSDLSIDIKDRPQPSKSEHKPKPKKISEGTIQLNDLKKLKLPKISWIVQEQQQQAVHSARRRP